MCLHTKQTEPEIAKKDIRCFTVVKKNHRGKLFTYYQGTFIKKEMTETRMKKKCKDGEIQRGLHSYVTMNDAKLFKENNYEYYGLYIIEWVIPKGTRFYTGEHNSRKSYASEKRNILKIYSKEKFTI